VLREIDRAILEANARLSHPEQVKRWAILANDLSIEHGDLTANLKLKRQAVSQRLRAVIEALYAPQGAAASPALLASGQRGASAEVSASLVYPLHLGQSWQKEAA